MKAKCINNGSYEKWLTKGKIYEIIEKDLGDGAKYFSIIDTDNGQKGITAFQSRFEVIKDKLELKHVKKSPNRSDLLYFTRKQLRELAKQSGVAIGRDKWDTVNNLVNSGKISFTITIGMEE